MVGIIITQELKDLNIELFKNNTVNSIRIFSTIPSSFYSITYFNGSRTDGYHTLDTSIHQADGFYEVIIPVYDSSIEKLGDIFFSQSSFTYPVISKTEIEIQNEILATSDENKQNLIRIKTEKLIITNAQTYDDTTALDNFGLFPMWKYPFDYPLAYKCQDFSGTTLNLYKCVQAHTSQADWRPKDVPALFTKVAYPGQIPVWVQPTGAQDAYNIGDRVYYPTANDSVYESLINANVWSPTGYPAGWQLIP